MKTEEKGTYLGSGAVEHKQENKEAGSNSRGYEHREGHTGQVG
jgi:hypothetical protein